MHTHVYNKLALTSTQQSPSPLSPNSIIHCGTEFRVEEGEAAVPRLYLIVIPYVIFFPHIVSQRALSDQSKEEYREAAHRLYMEERQRQRAKSTGQRSSSPQPSSSTAKEFSADE